MEAVFCAGFYHNLHRSMEYSMQKMVKQFARVSAGMSRYRQTQSDNFFHKPRVQLKFSKSIVSIARAVTNFNTSNLDMPFISQFIFEDSK